MDRMSKTGSVESMLGTRVPAGVVLAELRAGTSQGGMFRQPPCRPLPLQATAPAGVRPRNRPILRA